MQKTKEKHSERKETSYYELAKKKLELGVGEDEKRNYHIALKFYMEGLEMLRKYIQSKKISSQKCFSKKII